MTRSWEVDVAKLCTGAWDLSPHRTRKVIEELQVLISTDQLSDMAVAGVLSTCGMGEPTASTAARSIRIVIGSPR